MYRSIITYSIALASWSALSADQFIVKYKEGFNPSKQKMGLRSAGSLTLGRKIKNTKNLYSVKFPMALRPMAIEEQLKILKRMPEVEMAQLDHVVTHRGSFSEEPNDPENINLWGLMDLADDNIASSRASEAWAEFGTGGKNAFGEDIVVAVIDGGFDILHEDLVDNIFTNNDEIPGNGVDDDKNGYIDDVNGWNFAHDSDKIEVASHGTHVAGIIGAKGNNQIGITGVNWEVKILPIQVNLRAPLRTSEIIEAYSYILELKKLYLKSNGKNGANIVATNSSFGIDGADCNSEDFPIWNRMYDKLGRAGILSAVATANQSWNVDDEGDVPSACDSDYIISVTNTGMNGKLRFAAWGEDSIDLAAPGQSIYSTMPDMDYSFKSGTSMATPHVAGSIAYLHSVAGETFADLAIFDPGAAALEIKSVIIDTARPLDTLRGFVKTGGTLDIYEAASVVSNL